MTVYYPDVAFIGRAGSGKTTAAELLVKEFGYTRISFAAPLKVMCGTTDDRGLLQKVGVGVRELHEDAFVNLLRPTLEDRSSPDPFVIDDCRFPNEAWMLYTQQFKVVRITAGRNLRLARLQANGRMQDEAQMENISETSLDHYDADHTIYNDTGPEDLLDVLANYLNRVAW